MVYMKLSVLSRDDSQHQKLKDNCSFFGTKYFKYAWMCFRSEKIIVYFLVRSTSSMRACIFVVRYDVMSQSQHCSEFQGRTQLLPNVESHQSL